LAGFAKASPDKATNARMITTNRMAPDYTIRPRSTSEMSKKREKTPQIAQHNGVGVEAG
jgi:hypothetical protein